LIVSRQFNPQEDGIAVGQRESGMAVVPIKLTFEEFCQLPESNLPHELIDGKLRMPAAPNWRHQQILGNLYAALRQHVLARNLGRVALAPVDVVLDRMRPLVLQPDVFFITHERAGIVQDKVIGAPDLTVEIFSGSGAVFDRTEKAAFYAQYGVKEYWLVDPDEETVEVRRLETKGYETVGRFGRGDAVRSSLLHDLILPADQIFAA
jgi:Uma2 family endonuclease